MRAIVLSVAFLFGLGFLGSAQSQAQSLKGVYAPPGSSGLGSTGLGSSGLGSSGLGSTGLGAPLGTPLGTPLGSSSTLAAPSSLGAVGAGPRVIVPGDPAQGQTLPDDVTPTPIPDRPGYGEVTVNGHRAIVDLRNNRIFQLID